MGRPPQSDEILKLTGRWRADRHGNRPAAIGAIGRPSPWLDKYAKRWWTEHAPQLVANGVGEGDRSIIESAAVWYSVWRRTLAAIEAGDGDYRTFIKCSMAWKSFASAASRLGIGPTERAKIRSGTAQQVGQLSVAARKR
jgi:phage terminase small subunit